MTRFCVCAGIKSPVDLSRKRKQVAEIFCKSCRRPLVHGIKPPSASMLSTVEPALTNFVNTELTWKTVKKGTRSTSRRSRRPAKSLNVAAQLEDKSAKREESSVSSVSESEKFGVAVLGRRFADKIEHVPFKKRRLLLRSPSPPPQTPLPLHEDALSSQLLIPSPRPEDSDQAIDSKCASGQWCSDSVSNWEMGAFNCPAVVPVTKGIENVFINKKLLEVNGKLGYTEDFSGIALLAAAACNNSIIDDTLNVMGGQTFDESLTSEGIGSSVSVTSFERTATSSEMGSLLLKDSSNEDNKDGSSGLEYSAAVSENVNNNRDCEAGKRPASLKDERLHWDLNTVMEAWELPCDDLNIGSQINGSDGRLNDVVHSEKSEKSEGAAALGDPGIALEQVNYSIAETEVSTQVFSQDKCSDYSPCLGSEPISSRLVSEENINTSPTNVVKQEGEDCFGTSAMQLGKTVSIENIHLGKQEVPLDLAIPGKVVCEIDSIHIKEDSNKSSCLPDKGTSSTHLVTSVTCQMSEFGSSVSKLGKAAPEHEKLSLLGNSFEESQLFVAIDVEEKQDTEAFATSMDSSLHVEPKELLSQSVECFDKIALQDPTDSGNGSDISHGGHGHVVGVEKMTEIQAGYESPFEDGELRESRHLYSWEENEIDETECVDYDSDNRDSDEFDAANHCLSEVGSGICQIVNNENSTEKVGIEEFSVQDQLLEDHNCSTNRTSEANNVCTQIILASDCGIDVKGSSAGEVGSKATREKLLPIDRSSSSDGLLRKDTVYTQRNRSNYDLGFRAGRVFGSEKSLGRDRPLQMQDRSLEDGHWVDSPSGYWDSRNHYSTGYHDSQGTAYPRPRGGIANSAAKVDGLEYRDQRRSMNYNAKNGYHRPPIRRRSPDEHNDAYSMHRRIVSARDNNHVRSRGRSGVYRQGVIRGPREEYHEPISDDPPHYLARRERSYSPVFSRGGSFSRPHRNSRSRSRSRSPVAWRLQQRERNVGFRRLRSPNFRPETTVERTRRMPFRNPNFEADEDDDFFMSPPRNRFNDRTRVVPRLRERKSPGRLFERSQRFNAGGSPRRMKEDDNFRPPMVRPGRFTDISSGAVRGRQYNNGNNSDRTERGERYNMIHRGRHFDTNSGVMRRFHYDAEDRFEDAEDRFEVRNGGVDRRDERRSGWRGEARGGRFRYNNERMYDPVPKSSGIRGYDDEGDASPS